MVEKTYTAEAIICYMKRKYFSTQFILQWRILSINTDVLHRWHFYLQQVRLRKLVVLSSLETKGTYTNTSCSKTKVISGASQALEPQEGYGNPRAAFVQTYTCILTLGNLASHLLEMGVMFFVGFL